MSSPNKKTKGSPQPIDIHVGKRLRLRRSILGVSQEKLAEAVGLTFQQIQKYERGMNRVSAGRLYDISQILGVPVAYFFDNFKEAASQAGGITGLSDNEQDPFLAEDVLQNKETRDLLAVYYSIKDEKLRKDLYKFVKSMADKMAGDDT